MAKKAAAKKSGGKVAPPKKEKVQGSNLFPTPEIPKEVKKLATEMKTAEIERKRLNSFEKEKRGLLAEIMKKKKWKRFELEIDGIDYEFQLESNEKLKSKKLKEDED
jgi:hypothetical protein